MKVESTAFESRPLGVAAADGVGSMTGLTTFAAFPLQSNILRQNKGVKSTWETPHPIKNLALDKYKAMLYGLSDSGGNNCSVMRGLDVDTDIITFDVLTSSRMAGDTCPIDIVIGIDSDSIFTVTGREKIYKYNISSESWGLFYMAASRSISINSVSSHGAWIVWTEADPGIATFDIRAKRSIASADDDSILMKSGLPGAPKSLSTSDVIVVEAGGLSGLSIALIVIGSIMATGLIIALIVFFAGTKRGRELCSKCKCPCTRQYNQQVENSQYSDTPESFYIA